MKAFNVSFYDDRRLCFMEGCTPSMLAFKWDHAVCAPAVFFSLFSWDMQA